MSHPLVHAIILSYNGKDLTLACLDSVRKSVYDSFKIVVVDNASQDGSAESIDEKFTNEINSQDLILIRNDRNLGFAGGNNVGMRFAIDNGADYILLLNNDTIVDENMIAALVDVCEKDSGVGIVGPKIYYFDPPDQIWFAGAEILLHRGLSRHVGIREKDTGQHDETAESDYITGCAMLVRRSVIERIGFLDPVYQMYSEDADFCMRAKHSGFRIRYVPAGKIWHKISAATGGHLKWRKMKLRLRSNFIFFKRYARWFHWFSIPWFFILDGMRILFLLLIGKIKNE